MGRLSFSLDAVPPFRLDLTVWAIRRRPENEMDLWDGETYERVLAVEGKPVLVRVTQSGSASTPQVEFTASATHLPSAVKATATTALERLLGLRADLRSFYRLAAEHRRLHELTSRFRDSNRHGFRPSGKASSTA